MIEELKHQLHDAGFKVTGPRVSVFRYLQENDPSTVEAVLGRLTPQIDRASIYRTLSLFRELGIIQDIVAGGRRMIELTDSFGGHHHHLSCLKCGRSETVADPALESDLDRVAQLNGFRPVSHQIEISGICAECQGG